MADIQEYDSALDMIAWGLTQAKPFHRWDIKQELVAAVLEYIDEGFDRKYLLALARNKAVDALRSKRYNFSYGGKFPHVYLGGFVDDNLEDLLGDVSALTIPSFEETVVEKCDVNTALEKLDDEDWLLIVLRFWYDFTEETLGKMFGVSRSGICRRCKKIFGILRESLAE